MRKKLPKRKLKRITPIEKLFSHMKGRVFVFIDAANLEKSVKDIGMYPPRMRKMPPGYKWKRPKKGQYRVDYKKLKNFFGKNINLRRIAFYSVRFDTEEHDQFLAMLKANGYELETKPLKIIKTYDIDRGDIRKANFDVEISVDAVSMIEKFETFVLFSGDSDFAYLLDFLKAQKKRAVVVSRREHIAKELIASADFYQDILKLRNIILRKIR
jgi:uncharacterized LabA/DUF88 family protein